MILVAPALATDLGPDLTLAGHHTDVGLRGWVPRLGLPPNPHQLHIGAHLDFGNFVRHVSFPPAVELGGGDNVQLFTANAEARYRFEPSTLRSPSRRN
jgi:hypothetical protein